MSERLFLIFLFLICVFGFLLRFVDYWRVPSQTETFDELIYAWGGATLLKEGIPGSWSNFSPYKNITYFERYGVNWKIVSPMIEKPPLYFILSGVTVLALGPVNPLEVDHKVIRVLPLVLSFATIFLTGLLAARVFSGQIGLLAAFLYATTPTIVFANRLSLTENLLAPLSVLALLSLSGYSLKKIRLNAFSGLFIVLSVLTKQSGAAVGASVALIFVLFSKWRDFAVAIGFLTVGVLIYFLYGAFYDFGLFLSLQKEWRIAHTLAGLPEVAASIFRYPSIGAKDHVFLDGSMLLSYILLFSAPVWFLKNGERDFKKLLLIVFPFVYLAAIVLGESGSAPYTFFGWYLYPLFPYAVILLAKFLYDFWQKGNFFELILLLAFVGSSSVRFLFLNVPREFQYRWQWILVSLFIFSVFIWFVPAVRKKGLLFLFVFFSLVNSYAIFRLGQF